MNNDNINIPSHNPEGGNTPSQKRSHRALFKWIGIGAGAFIGIFLILLIAVLLWATPERLTSITEKEAAGYLKGDIKLHGLDYSIFSSFPYLAVSLDSLTLHSSALDGIDSNTRVQLPSDCDLLMKTGSVSGRLNIVKLIFGKIDLHRLAVDKLRVNLVSINDSVNNYNIFPVSDTHGFKVPKFQVDSVSFTNPEPITFFSLESRAAARAGIKELILSHIPKNKNSYNLRTSGEVSATVNDLPLLADFPFSLDGTCNFDFNPFKIILSDYAVNLGNLKGILNLNLRVDSDPQIEKLSYEITEFNPLEMLIYIPQGLESVPLLKNITSSITVNATAAVETPYSLLSSTLPSLTVNFNIPEGYLKYCLPNGDSYTADRINLAGELSYNSHRPAESFLTLSNLEVASDKLILQGNAFISDIFGNPLIKGDINIHGDLQNNAGLIPGLNSYSVKGNINCVTEFEASLSSTVTGYLENLKANSKIKLENINLSPRSKGAGNISASIGNLNLKVDGGFNPKEKGDKDNLAIICQGERLAFSDGKTKAGVHSLNIASSISKTDVEKFTPSGKVRKHKDSRSLGRIKHSPEYLTFTPVKALSEFLDKYSGNFDLNVKGAHFSMPAWPSVTHIPTLELSVSPRNITIRNLDVSNRSTRAHINGSIGNIHSFLTSASPVKIPVNLNVRIDTINLNQLAGTYERGLIKTKGSIASITAPKPATPSSADSVAMLIPRNIKAMISASADETIYTNLRLTDLMTKLSVDEGNLSVDTLTINSGFGDIYLKFGYKTSDIDRLNMSLSAGIPDINLLSLYKNFPKILEMAPEANNLHGIFSGRVSGDIDLFPTMYANIPSLRGVADIKAWDLVLHQNKFIRRITKMMMIPDDNDIYIEDLNIKARFRHNLLEIYPFDFNFSRYSLQLAGVNNFNGKLYYHIGVKESPLDLPFGINVEGYFHHPKLRSGGVEYKPEKAEEVTSDIMMVNKINIMRELKFYLRQFIHHASKSDTIPGKIN